MTNEKKKKIGKAADEYRETKSYAISKKNSKKLELFAEKHDVSKSEVLNHILDEYDGDLE